MADLLTTQELQELLCVDRKTIYRMLHDGRLPGVRVGGQWRFQRSSIEAWLTDPTIAQRSKLSDGSTPNTEILPLDCFASVQEIFAEAIDVGAVTTDLAGNPLIAPSNSCAFCRLMMASPQGKARCIANWGHFGEDSEPQRVERCHAGLNRVRAGVQVEGTPMAMVVACQYVTSPVELQSIVANTPRLAQECGIPVDELQKAAAGVRELDTIHAAQVMHLLVKVADTFSKIGTRRLELLSRLRQVAKLVAV